VTQDNLFEVVPSHRLDKASREELIQFIQAQERVISSVTKEVKKLKAQNDKLEAELKQQTLLVDDQYIILKNQFFGKSSERESTRPKDDDNKESKPKKTKIQLPSLRYPNAPLIERHVELQTIPNCSCCGTKMHDTGMTQTSEFLTVIPKQYIVVRQIQHKYGCGKCHSEIKTAPAPKRIMPGSSLSDEMTLEQIL
jgi:transposase